MILTHLTIHPTINLSLLVSSWRDEIKTAMNPRVRNDLFPSDTDLLL